MPEKHTILCVDDEQDIVDALFRMFRKSYNVLTATSGSEAIEIIKANKISLIISDQKMPKMTGVEVLSRSIEFQPDCMRILLTGYTDIESVIDAINTGAVYKYITKPWDPVGLDNTVTKAIEKLEMKNELKAKNNELKLVNEELKSLDKSKTQFMYLINHELKTPLTVITSYTDILAESKLDDEQKLFVDKIKKSNNDLQDIINDVLKLIQAETQKLKLNSSNFLILPVLSSTVDRYKEIYSKKGIDLKITCEPGLNTNSDPAVFTDIIGRLIDNCYKFAPGNSTVQISVFQNDQKCDFKFSNQGENLSPEKIQMILKPFTLDEHMMNHSQGLGIGLSLARAQLNCLSSNLNISSENENFCAEFSL